MGVHFGVLVSDVPSSRLIAALDEIAPVFADQGPIGSLEEINPSGGDEWELAAGDLDDRGYVFDGTLVLSSDADLIGRVAASTGGLVVGSGAETVSGTFWLVAARAGHRAILAAHGFNYEAWYARARKRKVTWREQYLDDGGPPPWRGAEDAALERHRAEHGLADKLTPTIAVRRKPWWRFW